METIGMKLKKHRKNVGLTQQQVATKANISRSHYASLESDKYNPSLDTLKNIANVLNIDVTLLLEKEDVENENKTNEIVLSKNEQILLDDYRLLNTDGQKEANKRVKELTAIPFYRTNEPLTIAAHSDKPIDNDEMDKIHKDLEDMMKW